MSVKKDQVCLKSIESITEIYGGKWSFIILEELHLGPKRFNQLSKELNINTKSLTDTLRHLEKHGIINRHVFATVPVTVEYSLTQKGKAFDQVLDAMKDWAEHWLI